MTIFKIRRYKNIARLICLLAILATLAFIWGNSIKSAADSQQASQGILDQIKPALEVFVGEVNATDYFVRKLAHFTEFGVLGFELSLLLILLRRVRVQAVINCAFFGLAVALIDETIQIFSGRGPQVKDIWIDFSGLCLGLLVTVAVYLLIRLMRSKLYK